MPRVKATVQTNIREIIAVIAPFGRGGYSGYTTVPYALLDKNVLVKPLAPASATEELKPLVRPIRAFGDKGAVLIMPGEWKGVRVLVTPTNKQVTEIQPKRTTTTTAKPQIVVSGGNHKDKENRKQNANRVRN